MLKQILENIAAETGVVLTVERERSWLVARINDAARELYEKRDLIGSIEEKVFQLDLANQVVSLPHYVGQVRAVRHHDSRARIRVHDLRPRYKTNGWTENLLAWRIKGKYAIAREIGNASLLTLSIPLAEESSFEVVIVGATEDSERVVETVSFAAGDTEKTTSNAWRRIDSILNSALHTYDVTVTDVDENVLAVLPNNELRSEYTWVQVIDFGVANAEQDPVPVEVLYKKKLRQLEDDYDEFVGGLYDKVLVWKTLEHYFSGQDAGKAVMAHEKVRMLLGEIEQDATGGQQMSVDFEPNLTLGMFDRMEPRRHGEMYGPFFPGSYPP